MIVFNLTTVASAPDAASFQTSPIQWFQTSADGTSTDMPVEVPNMFTFQRISNQTVTLLDFNSNHIDEPYAKNHHFNLVVVYRGLTYGSDPTIINDPPIE